VWKADYLLFTFHLDSEQFTFYASFLETLYMLNLHIHIPLMCPSVQALIEGGSVNLSCFHDKKSQMTVLVHKATKFMFAQDTLKYFEVHVIIGIVGSNIDLSC
jgi:hypothetical protein